MQETTQRVSNSLEIKRETPYVVYYNDLCRNLCRNLVQQHGGLDKVSDKGKRAWASYLNKSSR